MLQRKYKGTPKEILKFGQIFRFHKENTKGILHIWIISPNIHTLQRKYTGNHSEFENPLQNPSPTKQIQKGSFKSWKFLHFFKFYKEHTTAWFQNLGNSSNFPDFTTKTQRQSFGIENPSKISNFTKKYKGIP